MLSESIQFVKYGRISTYSISANTAHVGETSTAYFGTNGSSDQLTSVNNNAVLIPVVVPQPVEVFELAMYFGDTSTRSGIYYDIGIYDASYNRVVSTGAIDGANPGTAIRVQAVSSTYLSSGRYYMALSLSNYTTRIKLMAMSDNFELEFYSMLDVSEVSSAHPLPSTITPSDVGPPIGLPFLYMSVRNT